MSFLLPALVGAGGNLLGGLLGNRNNKKNTAAQNFYNSPAQIRKRAEAAGFNPLAFVGPGVGLQNAPAQDMMGSAVAAAASEFANGLWAAKEYDGALAEAEKQNAELRKHLTEATLRPRVGGWLETANISTPAVTGGINTIKPTEAGMPASYGMTTPENNPVKFQELPVRVRNGLNGEMGWLDGGVARRANLKNGDTYIAEDNEAVFGDTISEVLSGTAAATGGLNPYSPQYPVLHIPPPTRTPYDPPYSKKGGTHKFVGGKGGAGYVWVPE